MLIKPIVLSASALRKINPRAQPLIYAVPAAYNGTHNAIFL